MKNKLAMLFVLVAGVLMVCNPAVAHHGTAAYDEKHPLTLNGTVTEMVWGNPHVEIRFDATDDKGNVVHWSCETLSPGKLARAGWTKDALKRGDKITITFAPAKDGSLLGILIKLVSSDGKILL